MKEYDVFVVMSGSSGRAIQITQHCSSQSMLAVASSSMDAASAAKCQRI